MTMECQRGVLIIIIAVDDSILAGGCAQLVVPVFTVQCWLESVEFAAGQFPRLWTCTSRRIILRNLHFCHSADAFHRFMIKLDAA